jgi:hypothetical protein
MEEAVSIVEWLRCRSNCDTIVSNTRLSTAATTLGIAGETFLNSSARARNDASLVGNSMFPEINVKERVQCNSIIEVNSPLRT